MGTYSRPNFAHDANLTHPWATRFRIPLVGSIYPTWKYEVALCVPAADVDPTRKSWDALDLYGAAWPSEEEAVVVGSAIDFRRSYYQGHWQAKMLDLPLDVDDSTNTLILIRQDSGWWYRRMTWSAGPSMVGGGERYTPDKEGLIRLLDERVWNLSPTWGAWKAANPEVFTLDS